MISVHLYRPFSRKHFFKVAAEDRSSASPSSTAPRNPAPVGEPLYLDVKAVFYGKKHRPDDHRRPLRPVLQGRHPGADLRRLRQPRRASDEGPLHDRHRRRRHVLVACRSSTMPTSPIRRPPNCCSSALAPTAPSARSRTSRRSSATTPTSTARPMPPTTRRNRAASPACICASARTRSARPTSSTTPHFVSCSQELLSDRSST
ncbi:MAG: hypothetical protein MZU97_24450 [Bacillus subtilis]|nr:hypothetical protein [Bacillus subtilis]